MTSNHFPCLKKCENSKIKVIIIIVNNNSSTALKAREIYQLCYTANIEN